MKAFSEKMKASGFVEAAPKRHGIDGAALAAPGKPLGEPVAWHGPIVMNTQEELRQAFAELQRGTFLRR